LNRLRGGFCKKQKKMLVSRLKQIVGEDLLAAIGLAMEGLATVFGEATFDGALADSGKKMSFGDDSKSLKQTIPTTRSYDEPIAKKKKEEKEKERIGNEHTFRLSFVGEDGATILV